jgi:hypothetical protein
MCKSLLFDIAWVKYSQYQERILTYKTKTFIHLKDNGSFTNEISVGKLSGYCSNKQFKI